MPAGKPEAAASAKPAEAASRASGSRAPVTGAAAAAGTAATSRASGNKPPAIRLRKISKRFGTVRANDAVDLEVAAGTIHGIIGENGAGKTTLVSILYGFYTPDEGDIEIEGRSVDIGSSADAIAHGIGMVHQHFMLVPTFTVLENVMLGAETHALLKPAAAEARAGLLELEQDIGLGVDPDAVVEDLPVGLQQRVEILKALRRGARILILDEPTSVLTPADTERLFEILRALRDSGVTILLITHKLPEIMAVCDAVSVMRGGRIVGHRVPARTTPAELAELMVGRKVALERAHEPGAPGAVALRVDDVTWTDAAGTVRLHRVSFEVRAGEVLGVAGVSGNGQSVLLDVLAGIAPIQEGRLALAGGSVERAHPADSARMRRLRVAHVPEDRQRRGLVLPFEARENAMLGYPEHFGDAMWAWPSAMQSRAFPIMNDFDVRPLETRLPAGGFSGGNQQKLVIAREFAEGPEILLLAQPTRGVDIGAIEFIHAKILSLKRRGCAILLVSADLDEILALSDRIMVMHAGRVVGTVDHGAATRRRLGLMMAGEAPG